MRRVHLVDIRAHRFPEPAQARHRLGRCLAGDEKTPAVPEKRGKAGGWPGMLGSGERMAGYEADIARNMGGHRLDHRLLDRPDIGDRRPRFQMRRDRLGHRSHRADRNGEHDQIGALHRLGGRREDLVAKADLERGRARRLGLGVAGDAARQPVGLDRMAHRRGDQAKPDQRHAVIDRRAHRCALNWPTAWTTRRQEASSPTVMRRQLGRP